MPDVMIRKDVDNLRKSLSDLTAVVYGRSVVQWESQNLRLYQGGNNLEINRPYAKGRIWHCRLPHRSRNGKCIKNKSDKNTMNIGKEMLDLIISQDHVMISV